jgi:hypothetical protein
VTAGQRGARILLDYVEACLAAAAPLRTLRNDTVIELKDGVALEVRWQSFRAVRGFTYLATICDEVARRPGSAGPCHRICLGRWRMFPGYARSSVFVLGWTGQPRIMTIPVDCAACPDRFVEGLNDVYSGD